MKDKNDFVLVTFVMWRPDLEKMDTYVGPNRSYWLLQAAAEKCELPSDEFTKHIRKPGGYRRPDRQEIE